FEGAVNNGQFVTDGGVALPMPEGYQGATAAVYGIRPEHLTVADNGVPATVVVVEPTGSETHVLAKLGPADVNLVLRDRVEFQPGQTVMVAPDQKRVHLFTLQGLRAN
ncbi:TOBE domain-containing protein, partial [Sinorhizobium sp. 8-89]|uniref:TOBE domain-containing protein n=1 Tax=Sinorhizobium sp. 7-81 TaxID=3049087 RepID=UPI0024C280BB